MEQAHDEKLEPLGVRLFFERKPRGENEGGRCAPESDPVLVQTGDPAPSDGGLDPGLVLDDFTRRVSAMAEEALGRYADWARRQAESIIAYAHERAAAEIAEARRAAESILDEAKATAAGMLSRADEARAAAVAALTEAEEKAQTLLSEAEAAAARTRRQIMLAATQEAIALLETKRLEADKIIGEGRAQAEAEAHGVRERLLRAAEVEAQQIRDEAALFNAETHQRALALTEAVVRQLQSAAMAIEQTFSRQDDTSGNGLSARKALADGPSGAGAAGGAEPLPSAALPDAGPDSPSAQAASGSFDESAVLLIVSPIDGFDQLFALESQINALREVTGVEVLEIDELTARLSVSVVDSASLLLHLGELPGVRSVGGESPALVRLTLDDPQDRRR